MTETRRDPLEGRFVITESGCHIWQRARNSRGYGVVWFDGRLRLAHRVAWFLRHGSWPRAGLVLDHLCEVKPCVNADHLRETENWRNVRRACPASDDPQVEALRAANRRSQAKTRGTYSSTYSAERA